MKSATMHDTLVDATLDTLIFLCAVLLWIAVVICYAVEALLLGPYQVMRHLWRRLIGATP